MIERFKEAFREEAGELLGNLESNLLTLEKDPESAETIGAIFRAMHTLKGSSAMFGFDAVAAFTHELESIMVMLREGAFKADRRFIDLTLRSRDLIAALLTGSPAELGTDALTAEFKSYTEGRIAELEEAKRREAADAGADTLALQPNDVRRGDSPSVSGPLRRYRIQFAPEPGIFSNGTRPLLLMDELRRLGDLKISPLSDRIPPLEEIDPEKCYLAWDIELITEKEENAVRDVFIFVEGVCRLVIDKLPMPETMPAEAERVQRLGDILVERGVTTPDRIAAVMTEKKKLGEILVEEHIATTEQVNSALEEQAFQRQTKDSSRQELGTSSLRVASEKLDALVDLVGELVTMQARLNQTAIGLRDPNLSTIAEQFERLVSQLRDNAMSIRMLPIGSAFSRFRRVVRDLSAELGKEIELETAGAETELDKTVIERLNDPLVHLIRNSIDHGIEAPAERVRLGKPRSGIVRLSARHSGANVCIEVVDDGAGLDYDKILAKAVDRGLVPAGGSLSEQEVFHLIFAPGFSTAAKVTAVSGRGVGMDVVKREIEALGGSVVLASERGKGMSTTLKIPLTLAIIEGLLVRIGQAFYVLPLSVVDGCVEFRREAKARQTRRVMNYRTEILPYVALRELFGISGAFPAIEQIVVVNAPEHRLGLIVDEVIGDYQTVIKPLGRVFKGAEGVAGATILGDGKVALILDINKMANAAQRLEAIAR